MAIATFRFHDSLNFFLAKKHKNQTIHYTFDWKGSVKDMIESLNVPHPEIDVILVNNCRVGLDYIVQDGDDIQVHPIPYAQANDIPSIIPTFNGRPRFILDTHLGRLTNYLRMMGFDTLYRNDYPDDELAEVSHQEQRILLTRDVGLLKRGLVIHGYYVRNTKPRLRLQEITQRYHLTQQIRPFYFCMKCNGKLGKVDVVSIRDQLPGDTAQLYDTFHQCQSCEQIYWKGSHYEKMARLIEDVTQNNY